MLLVVLCAMVSVLLYVGEQVRREEEARRRQQGALNGNGMQQQQEGGPNPNGVLPPAGVLHRMTWWCYDDIFMS